MNHIYKMVLKVVFLSVVAWGIPAWAQLQVSGFADSYHALRIKAPNEFLSSRNRLRLEAKTDFDNTNLFVSLNARHNGSLPEQTGIELREAYFDYISDNWDVRIGRQIIIWGKADGLRITDVISPYDLTEFLARDYDDIRMPVDAFMLRFLREVMDIELIWLPIFQSGILPGSGNPWVPGLPDFSSYSSVDITNPQYPEKTVENSEFGGRIALYLPGVDVAISSFYTWNDLPLFNTHVSDDAFSVSQDFYRYTCIGADFSMSLSDFILRGEAAFYIDEQFSAQNPQYGIFKRNSLTALLGLDWYPGNDLSVSVQIIDDFIINYHKQIADDEHSCLSTLNISKNLLRNTLKLSTFVYTSLGKSNMFNRSSVDYALTDEMHLLAGYDIFNGNSGMFGQFKDNSEVWVKAKYSF